jgi:glycosyltransferase involved in cell wall biosynthesis
MNSSGPLASVMLATYEMPRHLELVLAALARQTAQSFELHVCDDGSGPSTRKVVERFKVAAPWCEVNHHWQENQGFRKCKILNRALRQAKGETVIFLDGDCVPHRAFVSDHLSAQEPGRYCAGRRLNLGRRISDDLTPKMIQNGFFDRPRVRVAWSTWRGDSTHFQRSLRVTSPLLRRLLKMERVDDLLGSNYSVALKDLIAVNGFDESYQGYGREDTDMEIRLQHLGLTIKSLKGMALQFHVWHPRREFTPANDDRLTELKNSNRIRCAQGLESS